MKLDTIKFPKQKSVRGGWFLSYILVLIVPLLLCLLLYNYSAGIITAESKRIYGSALEQARIDLDSYLTEIAQTLSRTMQDQPVQRIVTTKQPLDGYDQLAMVNTQSALLTIESGHPNVTNVWISLNNLDIVISSRGYLDQHLFYLSRFKNSSLSEDAWRELLHECHPRWEMVQVENEGGTDFLYPLGVDQRAVIRRRYSCGDGEQKTVCQAVAAVLLGPGAGFLCLSPGRHSPLQNG